MKLRIIFLTITTLLLSNISLAQTPTYTLTAKNFTLLSINSSNDAVEFDVYISHTNGGVTNFEYSGGQFFFSFNRNVLTGPFPPVVSDTSSVRYRIVGSDLPEPMQPRNPQVATATSPTADVLRLAINTFPGAGNGFNMTNNGFPGTKIVRMRLHNKTGAFNPEPLNLTFRNPPIVAFATKIFSHVGTTGTDITTPGTHSVENSPIFPGPTPPAILKLSVIPEGLYFPMFNLLTRRDTVRVFLRNIFSPYNIVYTAKGVIDSVNFTNKFSFHNGLTSNYYIQINHHNSIETWSNNDGQFIVLGDTIVYNFTTSNSQAYGNNLKLKGNKYCIYSGDINQDGWVDSKDLSILDNDSYNLIEGRFLPSDLNGDNIVDGVDFLIGDNNWRYVNVKSPLSGIDNTIEP